jgi:hypothetical protein
MPNSSNSCDVRIDFLIFLSERIQVCVGVVRVRVTLYVPASKKTTSPAAAARLMTFCRAIVSSVTPLPLAPALRVLAKEETGSALY